MRESFLSFTLQDDSYLESYISTIGVDFVSWFLSEIKQVYSLCNVPVRARLV
uniref:Uncharacterized protein n=1 Tax=Arundo donax TaxID=35708 RepID=A0A0A9D6Y5_ARUDO